VVVVTHISLEPHRHNRLEAAIVFDAIEFMVISDIEDNRSVLGVFPVFGNGPKVVGLAWFRDISSLAYVISDPEYHRNELWVQNIRGGKPLKVTDLSADQQLASSGFAISPNGSSFAVVAGGWKSDVVLLKGLR